MPTIRTVTVKSSGGDYSSLSAAEAGEQNNLVTLDRQLDIECYAFSDTAAVVINGWTTDATRYVRIHCPTAEGHSGVWSTSKYRLEVDTAGANTKCLDNREDYVRIEGLQFRSTGSGAADTGGCFRQQATAAAASSDIRLDRCLMRQESEDTASRAIYVDSGSLTVRNTTIYGTSPSAGVYSNFGANSPTLTADNLTVASGSFTYAFERVAGTVTIRNCYAHGGTDAYTGTMTRTTCAHSSATVFAGSTASVAHSTANFVSVTGGSEDYTVVSGSALLDVGTDLSGTFTNSINGVTRPQNGAFDIGASELEVAAGGQPTWKRYGGVPYARTGRIFAGRSW